MKKRIHAGLAILGIVLLAGCSPYTYHAVGNTAAVNNYKAFAWAPAVNDTENSYLNNDLADQKIKDEVTADMQNRGIQLSNGKPDVLVRYSILVNRKVSTYNESVYDNAGDFYSQYGYSKDEFKSYYGYGILYPNYTGEVTHRVRYKQSMLVLDMLDPATKKIIWRGYSTGVADDPEKAIKGLPEMVDGIMNKLQINKATK